MYVGVCVYLYTYICGCTRMFMRVYCGVYTCMRVCLCEFMCLVACCSVSYSFGETWTRFKVVPDVDQIHRRFEDRFMGWPVDQYRFVQWRSDNDSVSKPRYFMWVFAFALFPYLPLLICICFTLSFHVTIWCILPLWLSVSLHELSVIVFHICVVDMSLYQRYFMCW